MPAKAGIHAVLPQRRRRHLLQFIHASHSCCISSILSEIMKDRPLVVAGVLAIGILAVQAAFGFWIFHSFTDGADRGTFGDMFGAVNALFSGLALAGVIYAILLQRQELSLQRRDLFLQRQELELTRQELAKAADAQLKSAGLLEAQLQVSMDSAKFSMAKAEAEAAPILMLSARSTSPGKVTQTLRNVGATIRDLQISVPSAKRASLSPLVGLETAGEAILYIEHEAHSAPPWEVRIAFTDALGKRREHSYSFDPNRGQFTLQQAS